MVVGVPVRGETTALESLVLPCAAAIGAANAASSSALAANATSHDCASVVFFRRCLTNK